MTREEFMAHAKSEIELALGGTKNRLMNLVQQAWAEGKRNSETEFITGILSEAVEKLTEKPKTGEPDAPRVLTWEELINVTDPVWYEERDGLSSWALCTDVTRGNAYGDMSYEFFENYDNSRIREYANNCNIYWRCWTARPTDEQREAARWDEGTGH